MATDMPAPQLQDFQLLGLNPGATIGEIKTAYRTLAKRWHPDHHQLHSRQEQLQAERRFKEITLAYQRLLESAQAAQLRQARAGKTAAEAQQSGPTADRNTEQRTKAPHRTPPGNRQPVAALGRLCDYLLPGHSRYYAGIAGGLALVVTALLLLSQADPRPLRTVIPRLEQDKFILTLPKTESRETTATQEPVPSQSRTKAAPAGPSTESRPGSGFFTMGATPETVLMAQGPPDRMVGSLWFYGLSEVRFRRHRVHGYNNFDGRLRVRAVSSKPCDSDSSNHFTLGSSRDQVICAQGTPSRVDGNRWYYGLDVIRFKHDVVAEYSNSYGRLKVQMVPGTRTDRRRGSCFRIGSNKDEVLSLQGTPMEVHNNTWYYFFSDVQFSNDRVRWVNDPTGQLNFPGPTWRCRL